MEDDGDDDTSALSAVRWLPIASDECSTMKEAIKAIRAVAPGKWKWAKCPGNGVTQAYFVCNAHVGCGYVVRASSCDSGFILHAKGQHSTEVNNYKRKNSSLTFEEEAGLRLALDVGGRPGGLLASWTKEAMQEKEKDGLDPLDYTHDEGGMEGARRSRCRRQVVGHACDTHMIHVFRRIHLSEIMYSAPSSGYSVSSMYLRCIQYVSYLSESDTCIRCVFR